MDRFRAHLLRQGYSPKTQKVYRIAVGRGLALGLGRCSIADVLGQLQHLAPETRKTYRSAFIAWEKAMGRRPTEAPKIKVRRGLPRPVEVPDLARYLGVSANQRERIIQGLLVYQGLRLSEAAGLPVASVLPDRLFIVGKGDKERTVPLHPLFRARLHLWCSAQRDWVLEGANGHLSPERLRQIHYDLCDRAGISRWTPHRGRHTFATEALAVSGDIMAVKELLGHSSVATTEIYTRVRSAHLTDVVAHMYA